MDKIELKVDNKMLRLIISENNWCQIYFVEDDKNIKLGANSLNIIISKLLISFLPFQNNNFFWYSGLEMFTIMNLMDSHSVIAGHIKSENELELIFLDTAGKVVPLMSLTTEIEKNWITQICTLLNANS